MSWSLERVVQFGVFLKCTTVEVNCKQEHQYTWYLMSDTIYSLQLPWKNHVFVQDDEFCNNTTSIGNYRHNGIVVCTMCIGRFEHTFLLIIDSTSLVKCLPLLTYFNVMSRPKDIQNWELLLDLIVYRDIQKRWYCWDDSVSVIFVYGILSIPMLSTMGTFDTSVQLYSYPRDRPSYMLWIICNIQAYKIIWIKGVGCLNL